MPATGATGRYVNPDGEFTRDQRYLTDRITADGRGGYPVEAGRYRPLVSRGCPRANPADIVRRLLGLAQVLSMGVTRPTHHARSWTVDLEPGGRGPGPGDQAAAAGVFRPVPRLRPGHHRPRHRRRPLRPGGHQRFLPDHP